MALIDENITETESRYSTILECELESLYLVSQVLSRSLDFRDTLAEVLKVLNDTSGMRHGMICLLDADSGDLLVTALHENPQPLNAIRYKPGEGVVGAIMESGNPLVVERISEEDRFLDRLGVYDADLSFIGVPIMIGEMSAGVLAAQPLVGSGALDRHKRFLQMVANLIGQSVRLARKVEDEQLALKSERDSLRRKVRGEHGFSNMVGHTSSMRLVFDQVRQVAKWNTTVLIRGESGTGKELIANAIHYNSPRSNGPFIKLNCAALPDTLLESELFGHEKGAFTGAVSQRKGRFEQAHGGTIFLDEIGEISPAFQAKLLRVLQEGEFERVGGVKTQVVDVRVVAATNKDLESEVQEGSFREDLYYRLNVMPINTPPLRERSEDIPDLARFLVSKIAKSQGRELAVEDSALGPLMRYDWPGNVRELENCLERAAVMSSDGKIDKNAINLTGLQGNPPPAVTLSTANRVDIDDPELDERERVIAALEQAGWVQAKAARLLGMTPRQIGYRIQTLNIRVRQI
ncbi:MAG: nif-specific transcriptional activator NifA [Candidatus Thiodiazotropha endolucinida]|uniref:Nif-specific regulatory protein n=1 Tax=Candidatus Thiodiazotropha endolucinida TaxID=1655433 RepID=A0A7Z0VM37_9GAMM|nr:nif-specific transcriptional activator NifA [Candidatus Thiodiazotropha endolucinida]MBT3029793.1 nif-specific transcriptional activator NifA [Candidatus Thiodiazotropha sp. (ex Lucina pensylvanica)]MBT3041298.1 nif-specific transcriptional activator NifA [Candidatus Thiodiazotropha sp. (ex Codakia orbicularis)]MBT3052489.1 nif-specific transcriptional activator NifA [Candidatus Thiodiazotropha sp. (ex Codakia orbicularis)]ODJ87649.1 nif-specific transcriptional activator NifA [Candidatus Th